MPTALLSYRSALCLLILVAACRDDDDQEGPGAELASALITEGDITQCGRTEDVYANHSNRDKELHVRVSNKCWGRDTLGTDSARVWVRDAQGRPVNNQDVKIPYDGTHRGTFVVPGNATLRIECSQRLFQDEGCSWEFKYLLKE
jgi:hypothetical protein